VQEETDALDQQKALFHRQLEELQRVHRQLQKLFTVTEGNLLSTRATLAQKEEHWQQVLADITADVASFRDQLAESQRQARELGAALQRERAEGAEQARARQAAELELAQLLAGLQAACAAMAADVPEAPAGDDPVWGEYGTAGGRQLAVDLAARQLERQRDALRCCQGDLAALQVGGLAVRLMRGLRCWTCGPTCRQLFALS
jgi:hypothetical protein